MAACKLASPCRPAETEITSGRAIALPADPRFLMFRQAPIASQLAVIAIMSHADAAKLARLYVQSDAPDDKISMPVWGALLAQAKSEDYQEEAQDGRTRDAVAAANRSPQSLQRFFDEHTDDDEPEGALLTENDDLDPTGRAP